MQIDIRKIGNKFNLADLAEFTDFRGILEKGIEFRCTEKQRKRYYWLLTGKKRFDPFVKDLFFRGIRLNVS